MQTKTIATVAGAAAAGGVLAFAGLGLATAATGTSAAVTAGQYGPAGYGPTGDGPTGYGPSGGFPGGPDGRGPHGTPVTGQTLDSITAAVTAAYHDATVLQAEQEDDGYEAHVRKSDGSIVHIELDGAFAITGEHTGPIGGPGGGPGGTPVTGDTLDSITAAVTAKYEGATVDMAFADDDGGYHALVTKADGTRLGIELDGQFAITGERTGPPKGQRGRHHHKPVTGAKADQVTAAVLAKYPDATVLLVARERGGFEAHVRKADGTIVHVELDKDFTITGEHPGPAMADENSPATANSLSRATRSQARSAVRSRYPSAKVLTVTRDSDGTYDVRIKRGNGSKVVVELNKRFRVTDVSPA